MAAGLPSPTYGASRRANDLAARMYAAFDRTRREYRELTQRARSSFETRDWKRLRADSRERLSRYADAVAEGEREALDLLGDAVADRLLWVGAKAVYRGLIADRPDRELAETFFNGVTRRLFATVGVDDYVEFVAPELELPDPASSLRRYEGDGDALVRLVDRWLEDAPFTVRWANRRVDAHLVADRVKLELSQIGVTEDVSAIEVLTPVFFRGTGAYLVGRLEVGGRRVPLALALRMMFRGIAVDAVLSTERELSILFSFTRSYFHVDAERPSEVVAFLKELLPEKPTAEIYISIGQPKQGKTELYRALVAHLGGTEERFEHAAGTPGLVMVVFTMPGLDWVLKVIRDRMPIQKSVSAAHVKGRYKWVYDRDRAGRLVDAQPFEHLVFPRDRFHPALLEELLDRCGQSVRLRGPDRVELDLAYVQRRLTPLDLYVRQAGDAEAAAALMDYAQAIKDLAASNIFPGDLLLKNFGVTKRGRVACYDYDELVELTEMRFRRMPEPDDDDDEMRAEPFFAVGPRDVFPEEFLRFLAIPARLRSHLAYHCSEIFTPAFWRQTQEEIEAGKIVEFAPYEPVDRLIDPSDRF
ncbi:MAG: bifunctional isocitrate dehydrogenase kinase/phosphatase [Sandaracinaceae bacterium]